MGRNFIHEESVVGFACYLAYRVCRPRQGGAKRQGTSSLEIGQLEIIDPIASVERTDEGEQSLILADRQRLAVAQGPASGRKVVGKGLNLS